MIVKHHNDLERKSDTAIFFGCGPSINDITRKDWEVLKKYDAWAANWFLYHDFIIPDFYYRDLALTDGMFFEKFRDHWIEKREGPYKNTKFLTKWGSIDDAELLMIDEVYIVHRFNSWTPAHKKARQDEYTNRGDSFERRIHEIALKNFKIMDDKVYFYGRATLCLLLVLMYQMGYKEIILYGNDLNSKMYFWSDRPKKSIHWQWAKQTKTTKAGHQAGPHPNIISVTTFVPWFNENYMNNRIFVGSTRTLLYDDVPYKSIKELK